MSSMTDQTRRSTERDAHGNFTVEIDYGANPKLGLWNSQVVQILALGNQAGSSPAFYLRQVNGQFSIASINDVTELSIDRLNRLITERDQQTTSR